MQKIFRGIFLLIFLVVQTLCFRHNLLGVAEKGHFNRFARTTESMIYARLAMSEKQGILSNGGVLLLDRSVPPDQQYNQQFLTYVIDLPIEKPVFYKSRPALQPALFSLIDRISPWKDTVNIKVFEWIASIASALCMTYFLAWMLSALGWVPALITAMGILLSPWLTVSGGHLFWMSGFFFLPFTWLAMRLHRMPVEQRAWVLVVPLALLFLLKNLFIGYELITVSLVMCTIPVFYYAFRQKWTLRRWLQRFIVVASALLLGLVFSVGVLLWQTSRIEGRQRSGIEHLKERLLVRTTGTTNKPRASANVVASRTASLKQTMDKYWSIPLLRLPRISRDGKPLFPQHVLSTKHLLLLGLILSLLGILIPTIRPLAVTTLISSLAPASWFLIFKAHSFLHPHLVPIAWYLPFALLICALAGLWLKWAIARLCKSPAPLEPTQPVSS